MWLHPLRCGRVLYVIHRRFFKTGGHHDLYRPGMLAEQGMYKFGIVIVFGKVGEEKVAHESRPVRLEHFQRLAVGKVSFASADAVFQEIRITPLVEHLFIVISLQESSVALFKVMDQLIAGDANVGKYADVHIATGYHKTVRICGVVVFGKCGYTNVTHLYRFCGHKRMYLFLFNVELAVGEGVGGDVYGEVVFAGDHGYTADMITVFVGDEEGLYFLHGKPQPFHPFFRFAAGDAGIYENGLPAVSHIVTIPVTPRIQ